MGDEERNARWQALMGLHEEFEHEGEVSAMNGGRRSSRRGDPATARRRGLSRKAARFDEALSAWTTWSPAPQGPDRRLSA